MKKPGYENFELEILYKIVSRRRLTE